MRVPAQRGAGGGGGVTLVNITVEPSPVSLDTAADPEQLTATGIYSDDSTLNLTSAVTWSVDDEDVATANSGSGGGLLTPSDAGSTEVTATLGDVSGSADVEVAEAAIMMTSSPIPNQHTTGAGEATYEEVFWVKPGTTHIKIEFGNHCGGTAAGDFNFSDIISNIAIGTHNGSRGFAAEPVVYEAQTVPGDGTYLVLDEVPVTPGVGSTILVTFSVTGGAEVDMCYAALTANGHYRLNTDVPYPLAAPDGISTSTPFHIRISYAGAGYMVIGDSKSVGCSTMDTANLGVELACWYKLGLDNNIPVGLHGLPGGTIANFADTTTYPGLADIYRRGHALVILVSVNSLNSGAVAMIAGVASIINQARIAEMSPILIETCEPQGSYPNTEVARNAYNDAIRNGDLDIDDYLDVDVLLRDPADHTKLLDLYSSDTTHETNAAQRAKQAGWEAKLGL